MTTAPDDELDPSDPLVPAAVEWPLETPFAAFGVPAAVGPEARCGTVSGPELEELLPLLRDANQLTRFVDGEDVERSLLVRVLVPGEPSPCADEG